MLYEAEAKRSHWVISKGTDGVALAEPGEIAMGDILALPGVGEVTVKSGRIVNDPYGEEDCEYIVVIACKDEYGDDWRFVVDMSAAWHGMTVTIARDGDYE